MLLISISNRKQKLQHRHEMGALVLGRHPGTSGAVVVINDDYVSRRHLRLEETDSGQLRFENLGRNEIELADATRVPSGETRTVVLPTRLRVGKTLIDIKRSSSLLDEMETRFPELDESGYRTISRPIKFSAPPSGETTLSALGDAPSEERLAEWFETLLAVQRSAFGSREFYDETARAIVDLVGLDRGLLLLRRDGEWETVAGQVRHERLGLEYSTSVVNKTVADRRTFFGNPQGLADVRGSLASLEAVVASPILNRDGGVVGVLYGSRDIASDHSYFEIRRLEAQVVQMLASSVSVGLIRMEMQERLKQAEQLAAVGQALGYIVHDLRGPLGNVQQLVELLRSGEQSMFTTVEQLDFIDAAVSSSSELLSDCLEFCRGNVRVELSRGSWKDLLGKHIDLLRFEVAEFTVSLQFDVPDDLVFILDPHRFARVIRNLTRNACEALKGQDDASVTVGARALVDGIQIWVADNGPGLPLDVRDKLFQPFATAGKRGGTGFGLAIAQQLVKAHNGSLDVTSSNSGTQFIITLPTPQLDASVFDAILGESQPSARTIAGQAAVVRNILLVDDSPLNRRMMAGLLNDMGFHVTTAENGRVAIEKWQVDSYDLVFMDLEMPVMGGLDAARVIRDQERSTGKRIPIIALTGHTADEVSSACADAEMDDCLTKPVPPEQLRRLLSTCLPLA